MDASETRYRQVPWRHRHGPADSERAARSCHLSTSMIKRIIIISGNYPPNITGGGEIATQILARGLAAKGVEVRVLTCSEHEELRLDGDVLVDCVRSPNIYWRFGSMKSTVEKALWHALDNYNPRALRLLTEKYDEFKPDLVVTSILENFGATAWLAGSRLRIPVVDIIHSYYLQCLRGGKFRNGKNCPSRCIECKSVTFGKKYLSRHVDGVIGVSRHVLEAHVSSGYFSNARQACIYNPIEGHVEHPRTAHRSDVPAFGYLGKLLPTKGIEEIIQAFSTGSMGGRLIVAGDGERKFEARLRSNANPAFVEFLGWIEPACLFRQIDYLIFPSLWNEPFGRGIAEAMSRGIPVLGARRGGIPELIDHGQNGFLYDPTPVGGLGDAVRAALSSNYEELSRNALKRSRIFSKQVIVQQFLEFMETVVAQHDS
jgi:glycosyltransferase involved in cell wall biosynthesis